MIKKIYHEIYRFIYTKLHKEFTANLQKAVDVWLASRGMTEENLVRAPLPSRGFAGEPFSFGES